MSLYVDQDGDLWAKDGDRTYQFTADDPGWTLNAASWDTIERNYGPLVEVPPLLRGEPAKPELVAYRDKDGDVWVGSDSALVMLDGDPVGFAVVEGNFGPLTSVPVPADYR